MCKQSAASTKLQAHKQNLTYTVWLKLPSLYFYLNARDHFKPLKAHICSYGTNKEEVLV
jgi:hypothetical protein